MNNEFDETKYVKGCGRDPYRYNYSNPKSKCKPQPQPQVQPQPQTQQQQQPVYNELSDAGTLAEVLNEITEKVSQSIGHKKESALYRQVITVPGPPGRVLTAYRRLPIPQPDVLQRIYVVKPQRDVIDLVIQSPGSPAAHLTEKTIYSRPHKPVIIPRIIQQQPLTGGQFTNFSNVGFNQPMTMNQTLNPQITDWSGRFDNWSSLENQELYSTPFSSNVNSNLNQEFFPIGQFNNMNQTDMIGNDQWRIGDQTETVNSNLWSGNSPFIRQMGSMGPMGPIGPMGLMGSMGQFREMDSYPAIDPYTFNYDSSQKVNLPYSNYL